MYVEFLVAGGLYYITLILSAFFDSWGWQSSTWTGQRYPKVDQRYGNVKIISEFTHLNMGILSAAIKGIKGNLIFVGPAFI